VENSSSSFESTSGYTEAISTWSVRYLDRGFECILSIQAESGSEALKKAVGAIEHLIEAQCIPLHKDSPNRPLSANGEKSEPIMMIQSDGKNPICPLHGVEMQKWSKNGRVWYAHRWEDYWCHGKKRE